MAERTLAIKYTSEGLSAVTNALGKVAFAFDDALSKAQDSIEEAVKSSNAALKAFDADAFEEAEKKKAQAAKQAANVIKGAYRELGVRSEADINDLKKQAISAFEAMKNSGVASASDIRRAQEQLERKLADLDRQLGDTRNNWDKVKDSVGGVNRAWSSFVGNLAANTVTGIFTSATSAITGFFGQLSSNIQRAGIQTENLKAQLKTIEGSVAGAERAYAQIALFAKTTPFELNEVTQAYVALANRGLKPTEKQLEQIGDMASSQQKSINQYVEAILDATTGENERLKEFGIKGQKSGDQVSFTFRGVTKTVQATEKAILDVLLGFSELDGVIGGMGERAKTTEGQMSNLSDSLNAVYVQLFDAIKPAQDALIASATAIIEPLSQQEDLYGLIGQRAQELADYLKDNPAIIEEIRRQLREGILITFEAISGTAKQVLQYLKDNPNAIRDAIASLGLFLDLLKNAVSLINQVLTGWKAIGDAIKIAGQELARMNGSGLIGPAQVSEQIKAAGGNDVDVRRALDRIQQESSGWSWTDRLFNEGKMQGLVRRVIDEEIRRLGGLTPSAGDFPGPAIPSGGAATLPVPKPAPSRSRSSSLPPPPPSGSTGGMATNRQRPTSRSSGYAPGFERLGELESLLATNPLFANNPVAMSVALAIAAGEVTGWLGEKSRANLFSTMGGDGNAMQGFAQFNTRVHDRNRFNNPSRYLDFLAKMLTGQSNLPTGKGRLNTKELESLIASGQISNAQQFLAYLQKAMPVGNWEGLFGRGAQSILRSRVLDVSLDRLTSQIPRSQISRERDSVRAFNSQESERQRENDRLNSLFQPNPVYPEIGVFNIFKDLLIRDFMAARDYAFAQLPNFGQISPPAEFAGFTFGASETIGANIPRVTYPERLLEMATKAREAMEALDARVQIFAQTGSVGVERVSSAFEGLGQRVTDLAQNALGNFFSDVLTGSRSIGDALLDLVSNFASSLLQMVSQMAATGLFRWLGGLFGGGGGFSFGGLFGGGGVPDIFGGGATFSTMALPGFSRGGLVSGRGGKSSDSIFARLSDGEFVLNAAAVDYWGSDFLSSLNSRRLPDLGVEFGQSKGKSGTTIVNNVSVSSPDANSFKRSERQIGRMLSEYAQRS